MILAFHAVWANHRMMALPLQRINTFFLVKAVREHIPLAGRLEVWKAIQKEMQKHMREMVDQQTADLPPVQQWAADLEHYSPSSPISRAVLKAKVAEATRVEVATAGQKREPPQQLAVPPGKKPAPQQPPPPPPPPVPAPTPVSLKSKIPDSVKWNSYNRAAAGKFGQLIAAADPMTPADSTTCFGWGLLKNGCKWGSKCYRKHKFPK